MRAANDLLGLLMLAGVVLALLSSLSCFTLLGWVLWPQRAASARGILEAAPMRSLGIGLLNLLVYLVVIAALVRHGAHPLALLLMAAMAVLTLSALPATVTLLGERVLALADRPATRVTADVCGVWLLGAAALFPVAGQVLLFFTLAASFGAGLTALIQSWRGQ